MYSRVTPETKHVYAVAYYHAKGVVARVYFYVMVRIALVYSRLLHAPPRRISNSHAGIHRYLDEL